MKNKKTKMREYMKVAFGGPEKELNINLKESHQGMNLTNEDFDIMK